MREAYLTGGAPAFTRTRPLNAPEQELLALAQEPAHRARFTYHDCEKHGLFSVANDLGLASVSCPRSKKCVVQEVFDPAGYAEHYAPRPAAGPPKLTPEQNAQLDQVLALVDGPKRTDEELRAEMERILGCQVKGSAQEMLDALREGLADLLPAQDEGDRINASLAQLPEAEQRLLTGGKLFPKPVENNATRISQCLPPDWQEQEQAEPEEPAEPELTDIEHYASLQFSPAEVCTMLGLDYREQQRRPEFARQMLRGKLIMQAQLRETIFLHAKNGSAPAQVEALKLIRQAEINAAGHND